MQQIKWFERKFDFDFTQNIFPSILERLSGTSLRLNDKMGKISVEHLTVKPEQKWSIQEHIGHLINLEPLWQGRLEDILNSEKYLRPTDLTNSQTDRADYNAQNINDLLVEFKTVRNFTLEKLVPLSEVDIYKSALHPRLETPMRVMDLFLFVAEHDDHHLAAITRISKEL